MKVADLFAGAGGASTGCEQAGCEVVYAANHWQVSVNTHQANHRNAVHVCQDLHLADWTRVPRYDWLWASPSCQGHAKARGKERPHHDKERATAWAVTDCLEATRPLGFTIENVPEMRKWELFDLWRATLERLGYRVTETVLCASSFGAPQERERLIIVGHKRKEIHLRSPGIAAPPASSFINFADGRWNPVRKPGRAKNTITKVEATRKLLGDRFLLPFYGNTWTGRALNRPLGTVTCKDRYALVDGDRLRMLTVDEYRAAMTFPADYVLTGTREEKVRQLGNAVPPLMARGIMKQIREAA
jgi:DNA (cytosine-5)-methyltransferase 1